MWQSGESGSNSDLIIMLLIVTVVDYRFYTDIYKNPLLLKFVEMWEVLIDELTDAEYFARSLTLSRGILLNKLILAKWVENFASSNRTRSFSIGFKVSRPCTPLEPDNPVPRAPIICLYHNDWPKSRLAEYILSY
jgi:hypothetical protein